MPIPPSKCQGSTGYDARMLRVAQSITPDLDVREALVTVAERVPMHSNQNSRDPEALRQTLSIMPCLAGNPPTQVIILDDVLTTGCSYVVCKSMLQELWPEATFFGLFVARRIVPKTDFDLEGLV